MLAKRIIPCLDVKNARVVKGEKFVNLKDAGCPVEQASFYADSGADEIVFLDITASHERRGAILDIIRQTADKVFIPFTVGGGIKNIEDIRTILRTGADKVSINTAAVENPSLVEESSQRFGNQCIVVAIDAKNVGKDKWQVYTYGGRKATGLDVLEWAKEVERLGAGEILLTSMDRDGTKEGYDIELTKLISRNVNIPLIASGGVGTVEHLYQGLVSAEADAVLAASIFHYGKYSVKEVKEYLKEKGVPVRI